MLLEPLVARHLLGVQVDEVGEEAALRDRGQPQLRLGGRLLNGLGRPLLDNPEHRDLITLWILGIMPSNHCSLKYQFMWQISLANIS